ncbi:hypothetical protein NO263_13225 [Gluconacetobacter entanii]|uniref:Uncharacterized protein n=1 Tax=Gluconacetobacter entanii TaxID=108528 RepID=A0ABT3K7Z1_9PROT|nr:hypothetical protein [Gluconacetobacter entanii]MCW4591543.1 hypothetical protein [Gluconacetobacter entanii]MCW4595413.1 hypothetical protein [Gluconacetobacter entanii]NPC89842.1 hypothetical protein [Gluconacetobacter entanii]
MTTQPSQPQEIEVGEVAGNGLRLFLAKEAQRLAEMRQAAQMDLWNKHITRAISAIGWGMTLTAAFVAASTQYQYRALVIPAALSALAAIMACIIVWPRKWGIPGEFAEQVMDMTTDGKTPCASELEAREALALRIDQDLTKNHKAMTMFGWVTTIAFVLLVISVIFAAIWAGLITLR